MGTGETTVTIDIPNDSKVMDDLEFLKVKGLITIGLEIIEQIGDDQVLDKKAGMLWTVLQVLSDTLEQYEDTSVVLMNIGDQRRIENLKIKRNN